MGFLVALRFLTVFPLPHGEVSPREMGRSMAWFPAAGVVIGVLAAALDALLRTVWPVSVASAGVIVALVLITRALHLDGLIDTCDGLFGRYDPESRLTIMRDSRIGSFGALGAFAVLLVKFAALESLPAPGRWCGLVVMTTLGRFAMVLAVRGFPYARPEGLGRAFKDHLGEREVRLATLTAVLVAIGLLHLAGAAALLAAALATWLIGRFVCARILGLTGDSYGAVNEIVEVVSLLTLVAFARAGHA